jgi:uncharacterized tellurite resistance protein B-like protein
MAQQIPQGSWFGEATASHDHAEPHASGLSFEVRGGKLTGRGEQADGKFVVDGVVEADGQVRWVKRYQGGVFEGRRVVWVGAWDAEASAIRGRWRVVDAPDHGTFVLRPGDPADHVGDEAVRDVLASRSRLRDQVRIDLEAVRFDGERAMLDVLGADPDFVAAIRGAKAIEQVASLEPEPQQRPCPRIRLGPRTMPVAFGALDRCREVLGLAAPVELYVENDGQLNAWVEETRDGRIQVTFTSAVLDRLEVEEITTILGHELGHVLLGHLDTRVASDAELSGLVQLRRLALSRYQELSADRVGLLCGGDAELALRTEFQLHTGITRRERIGTAAQIEVAAAASVGRGEGLVGTDGYDTHPAGAYRTLALAWFGRSAPFFALRGLTPPEGAMSEAALEAGVSELVAALNPAVLDAGACEAEIDELVALVGLAVAGADSRTTKRETSAIRSLSAGVSAAFDRVMAMPFELRQLRTVDLAEKLAVALPPATRTRIVEDLTMVAQVDGQLSWGETDVLAGIALLLQVPEGCPEALLAELHAGLD